MKQTLTIVCKLQPTLDQLSKLEMTVKAFADACNYVNTVVKPTLTHKDAIQALTYFNIRQQFGLSANLAVRVCARVAANRKTAKQKRKPVKEFKPTSADYDARIFSFREKDWTASLTTVQGRERIPLVVGNYQKGKLSGKTPTSAQLCKHGDGGFYLHVQVKNDAPKPAKTNNVIGVDFGRRDLAVTSTGESWSGKDIQEVRDKYSKVRASLQRKASQGTRSTRRRARQILQRLGGRERRYQMWLNHNISKFIILKAKQDSCFVAIEDLTGIRERTNEKPRSKTERGRSNSWAFYQLRVFLEYKGIKEGVKVIAVPPAYTSQTCHCCLHIGLRSDKKFKCTNKLCGWIGDADLNGALNIALWGRSVNTPGGSELLSCAMTSGLLKAPDSALGGQA